MTVDLQKICWLPVANISVPVKNLPIYVTNVWRCCSMQMYEAILPHVTCFFFFFFLTILLYIILFSLCNVLYLTILISHHQFYCTHLLFVISFSVMILFNYCAQPLIRGIMFNYYRISNIYTSFDIPVSTSKFACLEPWLVYTSAYMIP